jgi:hypothetical protein
MRPSHHIAVTLLGLLAGALAARPAAGEDPGRAGLVKGLEASTRRLEWKLPHAKRGIPSERATRTCLVFTGHAVLWSDEGEMGASDLELRRRPKGMPAETVCGARFHGRAVRPRASEDPLSPEGVFGRYLFARSADDFGILAGFALLDLETGATVYDDTYAPGLELVLEGAGGAPALTYWASLGRFRCIPRRGEEACWRGIRETHGIPAEVPQPDCEDAIAAQPAMLEEEADRSTQIAVHVKVPRLSRREATYLPDPPKCAAAP